MPELIRQSAQIYQFPLGGRRSAAVSDAKPAVDARAQCVAGAAFGAWYHDAAIQDANRMNER